MHITLPGRLLLAAASLAIGATLLGQSAFAATPAAVSASQQQAFAFDLAAGPLDQTLLSISRQSGLSISFQQDLVQGLSSAAVRGRFSTEQALQRALRGSGLDALPSGAGG